MSEELKIANHNFITRLHMNASEAKIKSQKKTQLSQIDMDNIANECKSGKVKATVAQLRQVCEQLSISHLGLKKAELVALIAKRN